MPATNKVGTQLLVSPHIKARAQALALIRHETVAEVYRIALEGGGLPHMEAAHVNQLQELYAVLAGMGVDTVEALDIMTRQKMILGDLFLADGKPRARFPGKPL
jgi:hypothetical protein